MSRFMRMGMMAAALVACGFVGNAAAQSEKKTKAFKGRLPNGWTKIGLSDEQETKIKDIQIKNHDRISRLEDELDKLKEDQMKAMKKILTADQLKMVEKMESDAKKKKSTKAAKAKPAAEEDEKPAPKSTKKSKDSSKKKSSDG